ncbi:MAG TPA: MMPL family transporter, partial [Pirellulales bacterium]
FALAQRKLFEGLYDSFVGAFLMIGPLLMFQLRGVIAGLIAMIPNVVPTLLVFGLMGHLGIFVDVGSMMTASVAIGISVDDTLHFLTWFRRALQEGKSRNEALVMAYHHCGPAMLQTNLMVALSMGVFSLTTFLPVSRFGLIMFLTLIFGVLCELVLIPAILTSPAGRFFYPGPPPADPEEMDEQEEPTPASVGVAKTTPPKPRFSTVQ